MNELEIIVLANHKFVSSHVISDREITIGSGAGCTVQLPANGVAPEHAIVHFTGRSCIIEDLESGSGITVKGQKVPSHMVKSDDEVGIAGFVLRFVIHRDVEHTPAPAAAPAPVAKPAAQVVSMVGRGKAAPAVQVDEDIQTEVIKTEPARVEAKVEAPKPAPKYQQPASEPAKPAAQIQAPPVAAQKTAPAVEAKKSEPAPKPAAPPKPAAQKPSSAESKPQPKPEPKGKPFIAGPLAEDAAAESGAKFIADNPRFDADATREISTAMLLAPTDPHPDDDDDEENEENFVAPFSLVSKLTQGARIDQHAELIAEAIFYADEAISYVRYLNGGRRLKIDGEQRMVVAYNKGGGLQIASKQPIRAQLFKDGRAQKATEDKNGKLHVLAVPRDAAASVELSKTERLHLQFREKLPAPPPQKAQQRLTRPQMMIIGGSILFHIVAFIFISLTSSDRNEAVDVNAGRFAQIDTKDLELEKPPPPPPPPKEEAKLPEPKPEAMPKPQPVKMAKQAPAKHQAVAQAAPAAQQASTPKPSAAASNLLSALGGQLSGGTPTSAAAAATTNLDAVQAPRGGGFKVAGVIGKMPGDGLRLASAGGAVGRIDTKSASEIAGGLGNVRGSGPSGKVRGVVTEPPARSVEVQGSLDRSEIQKVVNAHLYEVQACYEHQLVRDPNLSGKVVAEWVITLSGAVGTTRIKNSTVRSGEVASCIQAAIKRWNFPHPKGGSVTVTYPFVFSTVGM